MQEKLMFNPEVDPAKFPVDAMAVEEVNAAFDDIVMDTFGSQLMKEYEGIEDLPVMTGGPTWTGSGLTQDADDGDTGGSSGGGL